MNSGSKIQYHVPLSGDRCSWNRIIIALRTLFQFMVTEPLVCLVKTWRCSGQCCCRETPAPKTSDFLQYSGCLWPWLTEGGKPLESLYNDAPNIAAKLFPDYTILNMTIISVTFDGVDLVTIASCVRVATTDMSAIESAVSIWRTSRSMRPRLLNFKPCCRGLYASAMSICSSVCLFLCLFVCRYCRPPVKFKLAEGAYSRRP